MDESCRVVLFKMAINKGSEKKLYRLLALLVTNTITMFQINP